MRMNYEDEGRSRIFGPGLREKRYDTEVPRDAGGPLALFVMYSFALSLFCLQDDKWISESKDLSNSFDKIPPIINGNKVTEKGARGYYVDLN